MSNLGSLTVIFFDDNGLKTDIILPLLDHIKGRRTVAILEEYIMAWTTPVDSEVCVGMEVTSYSSAEI